MKAKITYEQGRDFITLTDALKILPKESDGNLKVLSRGVSLVIPKRLLESLQAVELLVMKEAAKNFNS